MKLQDLLKDLELGKVYTDKDRKPFKVNEKASYEPYKQIGTNKNDGYILHGKDIPVEEDKNPCWKGYKQVGMKEKDGRQVPNCVPVEEELSEVEQADQIIRGKFGSLNGSSST